MLQSRDEAETASAIDPAELRDQIDRRARPGQPAGSLVVDRMPSRSAMVPCGHAPGNRYDWGSSQNLVYALYGRGRYGRGRYSSG